MFTYVMKNRIKELIQEKLNKEFPAEVETRDNQDIECDEEMTSETEETDDVSEPSNENVNYLDSANMATSLESAMKLAEEEDLWIGDSGASSHMMGSEKHEFKQKLISGSVRTANGAHMKMLCEGDINVDVITKNGDITSCTLRVKMLTQMKIFNLKKIKILMKTSQSLKTMIQRLFKLVNLKQKNQQRPQLEWQMMSQWLQGQEAKLQQMNQLQQEQDKHLGQTLK